MGLFGNSEKKKVVKFNPNYEDFVSFSFDFAFVDIRSFEESTNEFCSQDGDELVFGDELVKLLQYVKDKGFDLKLSNYQYASNSCSLIFVRNKNKKELK